MCPSLRSDDFILEAFDCDLWCPVAQTVFHVANIGSLHSILGEDTNQDPDLQNAYYLDDDQLAELIAFFNIKFDRSDFSSAELVIKLFR